MHLTKNELATLRSILDMLQRCGYAGNNFMIEKQHISALEMLLQKLEN